MNNKNRTYTIICLLVIVSFFSLFNPSRVTAEKKVQLYYFYGEGCPHCKKEKDFLDRMTLKYPQLTIMSYEVWYSFDNATLFQKMTDAYGKKVRGVPMTFIGHFDPIEGYLNDEITGKIIEERIIFCIENGCIDPSDRFKETVIKGDQIDSPAKPFLQESGQREKEKDVMIRPELKSEQGFKAPNERGSMTKEGKGDRMSQSSTAVQGDKSGKLINIPLFGEIDSTIVSLPLLTVVIGGMDGFNPCAFFVLFLLLSILVYARSRKVMFLVGGIFVFFSGFIYFLFMAAWLNLFLVIGHLKTITTIAGAVAIAIATINIKDYFAFKKGLSLMISDDAKPKLYERTRNILKKSSLPSMIIATVSLAIAANAYELLCTAGFPMVYTRVLTMHNLTTAQYYLYLAFYNVVYIVPLASIVVFFSITLGAKKLTERQGQVLKLMSGMMMLFLGVVLIARPDLLNNVIISAGLLVSAFGAAWIIIYFTGRRRST